MSCGKTGAMRTGEKPGGRGKGQEDCWSARKQEKEGKNDAYSASSRGRIRNTYEYKWIYHKVCHRSAATSQVEAFWNRLISLQTGLVSRRVRVEGYTAEEKMPGEVDGGTATRGNIRKGLVGRV